MRKLDEENDPEYWKEFKWDFDRGVFVNASCFLNIGGRIADG